MIQQGAFKTVVLFSRPKRLLHSRSWNHKKMGKGAPYLSGYFLLDRGNGFGSGMEGHPRAQHLLFVSLGWGSWEEEWSWPYLKRWPGSILGETFERDWRERVQIRGIKWKVPMAPGKGATKGGSVGTGYGECKGFVTLFCGIQFCL